MNRPRPSPRTSSSTLKSPGVTLAAKDTISEIWKKLAETKEFHDITFVVGESRKEFKAHRVVMATQSDVMARILYEQESQRAIIPLPNTDPASFSSFLDFLYTGTAIVDPALMPMMATLADYYNVSTLRDQCFAWLQNNLSVNNVCSMLEFAAQHMMDDLHKACMEMIHKQTLKVIHSRAFVELSRKQVLTILQTDGLSARQIDLFNAVQSWLHFAEDRTTDQKLVTELLQCIQLPLMTTQELLGPVQDSGLYSEAALLQALTVLHLRPGPLRPTSCQPPVCQPHLTEEVYNEAEHQLTEDAESSLMHFNNAAGYRLSEDKTVACTTHGGGEYAITSKTTTKKRINLWVDTEDAGSMSLVKIYVRECHYGITMSRRVIQSLGRYIGQQDGSCKEKRACSWLTVSFQILNMGANKQLEVLLNHEPFCRFKCDWSSYSLSVSTSNAGRKILFHFF
ncbi:BTB/POZ domain-containing protein 2-like [Oscarella lobularis]|uniref:BTB/POZ domain-containing protein 2-like n=1 Tax=Oscarella lobularis TaxID=121494 RepID=UPI003313B3E0